MLILRVIIISLGILYYGVNPPWLGLKATLDSYDREMATRDSTFNFDDLVPKAPLRKGVFLYLLKNPAEGRLDELELAHHVNSINKRDRFSSTKLLEYHVLTSDITAAMEVLNRLLISTPQSQLKYFSLVDGISSTEDGKKALKTLFANDCSWHLNYLEYILSDVGVGLSSKKWMFQNTAGVNRQNPRLKRLQQNFINKLVEMSDFDSAFEAWSTFVGREPDRANNIDKNFEEIEMTPFDWVVRRNPLFNGQLLRPGVALFYSDENDRILISKVIKMRPGDTYFLEVVSVTQKTVGVGFWAEVVCMNKAVVLTSIHLAPQIEEVTLSGPIDIPVENCDWQEIRVTARRSSGNSAARIILKSVNVKRRSIDGNGVGG